MQLHHNFRWDYEIKPQCKPITCGQPTIHKETNATIVLVQTNGDGGESGVLSGSSHMFPSVGDLARLQCNAGYRLVVNTSDGGKKMDFKFIPMTHRQI